MNELQKDIEKYIIWLFHHVYCPSKNKRNKYNDDTLNDRETHDAMRRICQKFDLSLSEAERQVKGIDWSSKRITFDAKCGLYNLSLKSSYQYREKKKTKSKLNGLTRKIPRTFTKSEQKWYNDLKAIMKRQPKNILLFITSDQFNFFDKNYLRDCNTKGYFNQNNIIATIPYHGDCGAF